MARPKRVHQVWKGRNKFLCYGRLVFGPDAWPLVVTLLLITVPSVIFCTHVVRNLIPELSPPYAGYVILVAAVALTLYVLLLFLLTSAQDPGIVPRNLHPLEEEINYDSSNSIEVDVSQTPIPRIPRMKEVHVNGVIVKVKYCDTCKLYRPPRCSHCSICDNCVERFDHHCPWVGQCIGLRNYRYFLLFISSSALLCSFVISISAIYIKFLVDDYGNIWKAIKVSPASIILMGYCFIFLWFVGGLTFFHLYLIRTNQTTYENYRYRKGVRTRIYDRGCLNNFREVFCTRISPSKINFRAYVHENGARPPVGPSQEVDVGTSGGDRRVKVEDDREIGGDLLKISQRRDVDYA